MIPKFRAWRKTAQKMVNVSSLDWKIDENEKEYLSAIWWYSTQNALVSSADDVSDDFILMQSTGLFDKNGKEIFEGDIIVAMSQGMKATGEVKRRIDGYWLMYPAWQHGEFWHIVENVDTGETGVEVIGNIHENPELLEAKDV